MPDFPRVDIKSMFPPHDENVLNLERLEMWSKIAAAARRRNEERAALIEAAARSALAQGCGFYVRQFQDGSIEARAHGAIEAGKAVWWKDTGQFDPPFPLSLSPDTIDPQG